MFNIKNKRCIEPECKIIPCYNFEGKTEKIYCFEHKLQGMIDIVSKYCIHENCKIRPTFNYQNEKKPLYCFEHKLDEMVDIKSKRCIHQGCKKQPTFNKQMQERTSESSKERMKYKLKGNISNNIYGTNKAISKEYDPKLCNPRSVVKIKSISNTGRFHPTQKPVALMEYLIKTYTNENETVLDFTMGSGSTGVACVNTNRSFIGIEQDDKYFEIAKQRIKQNEYKLF